MCFLKIIKIKLQKGIVLCILNMHWLCIMYFNIKMKGFNNYFLKQPYEDNTLFACGWTKWGCPLHLVVPSIKIRWIKVA